MNEPQMNKPKSPLDALVAQISHLLEGGPAAGVADQVRQTLEDFLATFRLVPHREFEDQLRALRDLEAEVQDLSRRIEALEAADG